MGDFEKPIKLKKGSYIYFNTTQSQPHDIFISYSNFAKDVKKGDRVLLDDGKLSLLVEKTDGKNRVNQNSK